MARLPQPGGDAGQWGQVLNDFLAQAHNTDGTLKNGAVGASAIADSTITEAKLDSALQAKVNSGGTAGVVSVNTRSGAVTLTKTDVGLANADNTSDANKPVSTATQTALNAKAPLASPTFTGTVTVPTPTSPSAATTKAYVDSSVSAGAPDATTTNKGIVQLAGDLSGTATAPTVAKVNGVTVSGTPSTGQVLKATSSSAASWQADATGGGSGFNYTVTSITADHTATANQAIFADASTNAITITLPAPVLNSTVWVKAVDNSSNSVQVVAPGGSYIDGVGVGSIAINVQYNSYVFWSDGTNWFRW